MSVECLFPITPCLARDTRPLLTVMVRVPTSWRVAAAPRYTVISLGPVNNGVMVISYVHMSPFTFLTWPTTASGLDGEVSSTENASGPPSSVYCAGLQGLAYIACHVTGCH